MFENKVLWKYWMHYKKTESEGEDNQELMAFYKRPDVVSKIRVKKMK